MANFSSVTKAGSMLGAVGGSVRTDMDLDQLWTFQSNYRDARHNVEQMQIKGNNATINGIYYLQIPDEELARVRNELQTHMELK
jgi:anionic cell wall polymer biosynthesis LytR-Cps2A-Psr (LCP) family protein